jgi:hypothetical protein
MRAGQEAAGLGAQGGAARGPRAHGGRLCQAPGRPCPRGSWAAGGGLLKPPPLPLRRADAGRPDCYCLHCGRQFPLQTLGKPLSVPFASCSVICILLQGLHRQASVAGATALCRQAAGARRMVCVEAGHVDVMQALVSALPSLDHIVTRRPSVLLRQEAFELNEAGASIRLYAVAVSTGC